MMKQSEAKGFPLNNRAVIPPVGLGTSGLGADEPELSYVISQAIEIGYRLIDTANGYKNEAAIGKGIISSGIDRRDLFITSKLDDDAHRYKDAEAAILKTLDRLQTDYLDLFLIHVPNSTRMRELEAENASRDRSFWEHLNEEAWKAMEACFSCGLVRAIGVSNFEVRHILPLLKIAAVKPMVNQIKLCVGCTEVQSRIVEFCEQNDIVVEAYSPLGKGHAQSVRQVTDLSLKYSRPAAQIALRHLYQKGIVSIPKSSNLQHLKQNLDIFDFRIDRADCELLDRIRVDERWAKIKDPDTGSMYN